MADIAFRAGNSAGTSSGTSLSVGAPTGTTTGDLVIVIFATNLTEETDNTSDNNGATPFTKVYAVLGQTSLPATTKMVIYRRIIQGGDPSSYSFNSGESADRLGLVALTFSNPDTSTIFDVTPSGTQRGVQSGAVSCATVDITTATKAIHIIAADPDGPAQTFGSAPSGYTEGAKNESGQCLAAYYKVMTSGGATGAQTISWNNSNGEVDISFSLLNNAGGGGETVTWVGYIG